MYIKLCKRKIDELGRIVIPQEIRQLLNIKEKQIFDICIYENFIMLRPDNNSPICYICGESELKLSDIGSYLICERCIDKIKNID